MFFFFFKQKTAYEMRISDWSSDVCSSDLRRGAGRRFLRPTAPPPPAALAAARLARLRIRLFVPVVVVLPFVAIGGILNNGHLSLLLGSGRLACRLARHVDLDVGLHLPALRVEQNATVISRFAPPQTGRA